MMPAQVPAARLRLKRSSGWFAAGLEVSTALPLLSDAAFKLYMFLCLNVDRRSARMVWEPSELTNLLHRDCQSVTDSLRELCRRGVCIRRPTTAGQLTKDRISVEICDRFWPYLRAQQLQRRRRAVGSPSLSARGHADSSAAGPLAGLRPKVCVAVERRRIRSQTHQQPALLLRSGGRGVRHTSRTGLLEPHRAQGVSIRKNVDGSSSKPNWQSKPERRYDGNEMMETK